MTYSILHLKICCLFGFLIIKLTFVLLPLIGNKSILSKLGYQQKLKLSMAIKISDIIFPGSLVSGADYCYDD